MKIRNIYIAIVLFLVSLPMATLVNAATRTIHATWNDVSLPGIAGFRLYQENIQRCEIEDPNATSIDCQVSFDESETWFTLTYYLIDGTESAHSSPIPYSFSLPPLVADISANIVTGTAPLKVQFDATASSGDITSYLWMFGDGGTASNATPTYTFTSEGSYVVTLAITDSDGSISEDSITINVSGNTATNIAPTAAISSSSGIGEAPFHITLDGGNSIDSDGQIVSYLWNLGDGNSAEGVQISHIYTTAGTYTPTLTVTDDGGLTDSAFVPIIVESPSSTNSPPTADINGSVAGGPPPLKVSFDGSRSTDADGAIVSYYWNFGDGSTGNGVTTDHTYEQPGEYTIELIVADDDGQFSQPMTLTVIVDENYQTKRENIIQIINLLLLD